jgi:hypothetical protein
MEPKENLIPIRFNFFSIKFEPYKGQSNTSSSILNEIITYLSREMINGKGHLIDKHKNRKQEGPRELFMSSVVIMHKERRIRCSLALLRSGRIPMLKPAEEFKLIPLDKTKGSIAEQTHFFIDFSKSYAVICTEFNYHGPRISDIEFYFRNIARDTLKISKVTEVTMFMDSSIDKTLTNLKNVLNMDIKLQPQNLARLDTEIVGQYFTQLNSLGQKLKPKFIKLEAMYQNPGNSVKSSQINKEANSMIIDLIKKFKARPYNIDCFENFVVKYEDKDGQEEVFNLLKGKKEIVKDVDFSKITTSRSWYEMIEKDFDEFMQTL